MATKVNRTPPLNVNLTFETAANLLDILTAQSVHSLRCAEQGQSALQQQFQKISPLFHHLREYVEKNS